MGSTLKILKPRDELNTSRFRFEGRGETWMIKTIVRLEQFVIINAVVIINYTGSAAKSRQQASILNLLINNRTTKDPFFPPPTLVKSKTGLMRQYTNVWVGIRDEAFK